MCCCEQPNVNGTPGYRWDPKSAPMTRWVAPPDMQEGDRLLADEPGRCGGVDSHSHHYRLVARGRDAVLLVRHGGGDETVELTAYGAGGAAWIGAVATMDSTARYWLLNAIYQAQAEAARAAAERVTATWQRAAAEKRIKTRKNRGANTVRVWIEPALFPMKTES